MRRSAGTWWTRLRPWLTPSEEAARRWVVIASVVTTFTLPFALYQLWDLKEQHTSRTMSALMAIDQRLDLEGNRAIRHRLQSSKQPPLVDDTVMSETLGDYLDTMESLASLLERKLVDIDSVDEWFGDLIGRTAAHPEVRAYISESKKEDPSYYTGFENMAQQIAKLNPPRRSEPSIKPAPAPR